MSQDMTRGTPWKLILYFSIPLLIGNIFQQLYSMVDTVIVGRFVSVQALAAVGSTGGMGFFIIGASTGIASGFAVITSQRFGAKDTEGVRRSIATCIYLSVLAAVVLTGASVLLVDPVLRIMNTPADIFDTASGYIKIIAWGIGATLYYNMVAAILRALGDSRTPLYFLILSSVLNVVLDLLFIISFHMGADGAAIATVISQLVSAVLCTFYCWKKYEITHLKKEDFRWDPSFAAAHLRIGLPMGMQFSITAIGVMVLQAALNGFGSTVIAAYTAASKVESLVTQPFNALGTAMATYCGQNRGAGKFERIWRGVNASILLGAAACVLAAGLNIFCGHAFTSLFLSEDNQEIYRYSQQYLNTIAVFYLPLLVVYILRNSLQGIGEWIIPTLGGAVELIARTAVSFIFPVMLGYTAICIASPVAWIATSLLLLLRYVWVYRSWKMKTVERAEALCGQ